VYQNVKSNRGNAVDTSYQAEFEAAVPNILTKAWGFVTFEDAVAFVFHRLNYSNVYFCQKVFTVQAAQTRFSNAMYVRKGSSLKEIFNPRYKSFAPLFEFL
jgi:hypothetical protein